MEDAGPSPLETATTEELIEELRKRHKAILVTWIPRNNRGEQETQKVEFYGGFWRCMGLAEQAAFDMKSGKFSDEDDDGGEDCLLARAVRGAETMCLTMTNWA
jgi:hypothetical protein